MNYDTELRGLTNVELEKLRDAVEQKMKERMPNNSYGYAASPQTPQSREERLADIFTYHDDPSKVPNYTAIRSAAKHLAEVILQNAPDCADTSSAVWCVRQAVLWANAAVALDGRGM